MIADFLPKAKALDKADELSSYRKAFSFPKKEGKRCIYLCGNSLGLQPSSTQNYVDKELNRWRERGVEGHFTGDMPWVEYHHNSKKQLASLLGALPEEVSAMNNLTSNLHLAMISFYQPKEKRTKILIEKGAFPSDYYAAYSQIELHGMDPATELIELSPKDGSNYLPITEVEDEIERLGDELALVLFPGIQYYTGQYFDLRRITKAAHKIGALAGFDLAHAIGNMPMRLHDAKADFAVWCSYKYLNSGPGSVGGLFIHQTHAQNQKMRRLSGWWGHDALARFKMGNEINPIPTVDGWQLSNSNILSQAAHLAALEVFQKAGLERLRDKSVQMTGMLEEIILGSKSLKENVEIITPSNPDERGCQLSLYLVNHGKGVFDYLTERKVIIDWREPNVMRVAPVPLYNSFEEVVLFAAILEQAIDYVKPN
ncbi:MAG: kynureninase [Bacteroidota bacterium]